MKLKTFGKYIFVGMLFLVVVLSCVKMNTKAEETTGILYLSDERIAERSKVDGNYTVPTKSGYVFGGWYNDVKGEDPMTEEEANAATTAYAKWVPDYVLSVKAQVNQNALNDDFTGSNRAAIRLLTSVDSRNYGEVGFDVVRGDYPNYTYHLDSKSVFTQVRVVGEKEGAYTEHTPEGVFGSDSHFFEAVTFKNMPEAAVNTELTVTPYWITPDGTRVEGAYSIKTVNLGRSWVYIGSGETVNAEGEHGTQGHPYSSLESALDAVRLENGKVIVKENDTVNIPKTFKWNGKKVLGKTRNITVTGENGKDAFISFDVVPDMHFNDNVTFSNVKVHFATQVYANGYNLTIAKDTLVNNTDTNLYGGAWKESVASTNLQIHSGTYVGIYGGGRDSGGNVAGDTHINVTNATVHNSTTENSSMIIGGGRGSNTVGGSTNVTVGTGFNAGITVQEKLYSSIYGGAREGGVVAKDTNVIINDGAKVDFVFGGGAKNTQVQGTCNVTMTGGEVSTIWGGASTEGEDAGTIGNATFVKMTGGTIGQIFGGTGVGMEGDSYVSVSGGTVTRRIYGGCYHSVSDGAGYVKGTSTVVIGKDATLKFSAILGEGICAGSRFAGTQADEVGILIFEGGTYDQYSSKIAGINAHTYDYLINAIGDGNVEIEDDILDNQLGVRVKPNTDAPGTIANTDGVVSKYFKGEGVCEFTSIAESKTDHIVNVNFNPSNVQSKLDNCESRIEGIYYSTLEDAVDFAMERKDAPFVTLMKNVEIEDTISVANGQILKIQSDGTNKYKISGGEKDLINATTGATLIATQIKLSNGAHGVVNQNASVEMSDVDIMGTAGCGIYNRGTGVFTGNNVTIQETTKDGIRLEANSEVNLDNVIITTVNNDTNQRDGIYCAGTLNITSENTKNNTTKNGVTINGVTKGHGINVQSTAVVNADEVHIGDVSKNALYANGGTVTITNLSVSDTKEQGVWLRNGGTVTLTGFDISNTNVLSTVAAIYTEGSSKNISLENGTISANKIGLYVTGSSKVTATDVKIEREAGNKNTLAFVDTNGELVFNQSTSGIACIGNGASDTVLDGRGVEVKGILTLNGGMITNNKAVVDQGREDTTANGGGVSVLAGGTFTMNGGTISNNQSTNAGGGVYFAGAEFIMNNNATISYNKAANDGGGVYLASGSLTMENGNISYNEAVKIDNAGSQRGGGVCMEGGSFILNGGTMEGNMARAGGAIIVKKGTFTMNDGIIKSNKANKDGANSNGGAIYLSPSAGVLVQGGEISGNEALGYGGAICFQAAGEVYLKAGTIKDNTAGQVNYTIDNISSSTKGTLKIEVGFNLSTPDSDAKYEYRAGRINCTVIEN